MPLPVSNVSMLCATVGDFLRDGLQAQVNNITVSMGSPGEIGNDYDGHRLNLFFYRFEPSGFEAGSRPGDVWRIRMLCLVTAFGVNENQVGAGENELRMLGEVMRLFRETPIMEAQNVDGEVVRLQAVFIPLSEDQLNQIWSTQGDTYYHASVAYDMSLGVVVPSRLSFEPPRVGALGAQARGSRAARFAPFSGTVPLSLAPASRVETGDPHWAPRICFLFQGRCLQSLAFDVEDPAFGGLDGLDIWVAGDPGTAVELVWETWSRGSGWEPAGAPIAAQPFGARIEPDRVPSPVPGVFPLRLDLPLVLGAGETAGQAYLQARRSFSLFPGGPLHTVRSNPLLLSLHRSA